MVAEPFVAYLKFIGRPDLPDPDQLADHPAESGLQPAAIA
jgi:hypothetical protein